MPEANRMWEGLMDFSFRKYATPKMLKFLYAIHLLAGLIAGVALWWLFSRPRFRVCLP